jgi:hypothetical protein
MRLVAVALICLSMFTGAGAAAQNVLRGATKRRVQRQIREVEKSDKALKSERSDGELLYSNRVYDDKDRTYRRAEIGAGGEWTDTFTARGDQQWYSHAQGDVRVSEHVFKMGPRNLALLSLGFKPGEQITVQKTIQDGASRVTASTRRDNPDSKGDRFITYERELPTNTIPGPREVPAN